MGLEKLQANKFGSKMQDYKPPSDDPFDDTCDTDVPNPLMTEMNEDYTGIYYNWKDLHQQTRKNLLEFENPKFELLSEVEGRDQVAKLVSALICDKVDSQLYKRIAWATKRHCKTLSSLQPRLFIGRGVAIALC
jgi:hypothetical protein